MPPQRPANAEGALTGERRASHERSLVAQQRRAASSSLCRDPRRRRPAVQEDVAREAAARNAIASTTASHHLEQAMLTEPEVHELTDGQRFEQVTLMRLLVHQHAARGQDPPGE